MYPNLASIKSIFYVHQASMMVDHWTQHEQNPLIHLQYTYTCMTTSSNGVQVVLGVIWHTFDTYDPMNQVNMVTHYFCVPDLQNIIFCPKWFTNSPHIKGMMRHHDPLILPGRLITATNIQMYAYKIYKIIDIMLHFFTQSQCIFYRHQVPTVVDCCTKYEQN